MNLKECNGCLYMNRIPWGRGDRVAYRCMSEEQGHHGRVIENKLPNEKATLYRPKWCKDKEMKENAKKLADTLREMNLPYGNVRECARQLFDIVKNDEDLCKIIIEDLQAKGKGIKDCEKEIDKFARAHGGIDSYDAEVVIRKFYGLPNAAPRGDDFLGIGEPAQEEPPKVEAEAPAFDLSAFL